MGTSRLAETAGTDRPTVVALLSGSCAYSRRHAASLDKVRTEMQANGLSTEFIGINSRNRAAQMMVGELDDAVNFTIFQSTHEKHYWSQLGGLKDDVLIYDRCGRLTYFIPFPHSFVPMRFVELAIQSTHSDSVCGPPPTSSDPFVAVAVKLMNQHQQSRLSSRRNLIHHKCSCLPSTLINSAQEEEEQCLCRSQSSFTYGSGIASDACFCKWKKTELEEKCRCVPGEHGTRTCQCRVGIRGRHLMAQESCH